MTPPRSPDAKPAIAFYLRFVDHAAMINHHHLPLLLVPLLLLAACGRSPRPRRDDDMAVTVVLERREIRQKADRKDLSVDIANTLFDIELKGIDKLDDYLAAHFFAVMLWPIVASLEVMVKMPGRTRVWVMPQGYRRYRQRLYWGRNIVFLPGELAGRHHYLVFQSRGNYTGVWATHVYIPGLEERDLDTPLEDEGPIQDGGGDEQGDEQGNEPRQGFQDASNALRKVGHCVGHIGGFRVLS